jgi:hypothetical protein
LINTTGENDSALSAFIKNHLFYWRDDLVDLVFSGSKMRTLRGILANTQVVHRIFEDVVLASSLSRSRAKLVNGFYRQLDEKLQSSVFWMIEQRLRQRAGGQDARGLGVAMTLMASIIRPNQVVAMKGVIQPSLKNIFLQIIDPPGKSHKTSSLHDYLLLDALADMHGAGVVSLSDMGQHINSVKGVEALSEVLAIDPHRLIEHVRPQIQAEYLAADLGL